MAKGKKKNIDEEIEIDSSKDQALQNALASIQKNFGKGAIMKLGDEPSRDVEVIPTGSLGVDAALGVGGIPKGRVVEIVGPEMSGKSTLALHVIKEAQKLGDVCAFVDAEHALDITYAKQLGVDVDNLYLSQPDNGGEEALEIVDTLVKSGSVGVIVIDSVAALVPRAELEGEMGQNHMALQARLMSHALRKLTASIQKTNTIVIFINQIRQKLGVMWGSNETTPGGNALKFYASVRLDVRKRTAIKNGEEVIGHITHVKVLKNKVAAPFRECDYDLIYGVGIDYNKELIDLALANKIIEKSGSWYSYNEEKIGQGTGNVSEFLMAHPLMVDEIKDKLGI